MRATVITYVNPAVAAVLGVAILDEHFTVGMGVGFVLVLLGSVLATRSSGREPGATLEPAYEAPEPDRALRLAGRRRVGHGVERCARCPPARSAP